MHANVVTKPAAPSPERSLVVDVVSARGGEDVGDVCTAAKSIVAESAIVSIEDTVNIDVPKRDATRSVSEQSPEPSPSPIPPLIPPVIPVSS